MPYVYIIYSPRLNKYYVGACTDLERRLYEHSISHTTFAATGTPWELKYKELFNTLPEAKKRERQIKNKNSGVYIEHLMVSL